MALPLNPRFISKFPRMGDLGGEDLGGDGVSEDLCVHGSPLRERKPDISRPPSPIEGEGVRG